jgi:hypothetical protein
MDDLVINKANPDLFNIDHFEIRPSIRKSAQNLNGIYKSKKIAFKNIREVYKTKFSIKSQKSNISCKNSTEYLETERISHSATSRFENDISYSEIEMTKNKKSILQNLIYLYNEQNKIKLNTDKKYSRNSTSISLLKDGIKNSFIKYNVKEMVKFQNIDVNSEQQKYNLIEKSVLHILDYVNDGMSKKYKKHTFMDFLNTQVKHAYGTMVNRMNTDERVIGFFQLSKKNSKLSKFTSSYINNNYFDVHREVMLRVNSFIKNDLDGINSSNRDFYLLNLSHQNKITQTFSPRLLPKTGKLKLSSQMVVKSNRIMLIGFANNKHCVSFLKNDQNELNRSLNTTTEFIEHVRNEEAYRKNQFKFKGSKKYMHRKTSVEISTNAITSPTQGIKIIYIDIVLSRFRKFTSPSKKNSKINLIRKSIKNILTTPLNSGFSSTNASVNLKLDTSHTRESFLLTNPNFFKKYDNKKDDIDM